MSTTNFKFIILTVAFLFTSQLQSFAQTATSDTPKTEISIEIDPSTFALSGYGIHLRVKPKNSDHLLLGIGAYAMDFPDLLVNINSENRDKGWDVRLNNGVGLFAEHHFSEVNKKFFVGTQIAIHQFDIEHDVILGEESFSNLFIMALGGYTWQPFDFGLYFKFWGGLGYNAKISGENVLGNLEYDHAPISMFGALHLGYTF